MHLSEHFIPVMIKNDPMIKNVEKLWIGVQMRPNDSSSQTKINNKPGLDQINLIMGIKFY